MSTFKADLKRAGMGSIELDGHDISNAVGGFSVDVYAGDVTRVRLDVIVIDTTGFRAERVQAFIPPATEELLIRLGWTPPQAEPVEVRTEVKLDGKAIHEATLEYKRRKGLE